MCVLNAVVIWKVRMCSMFDKLIGELSIISEEFNLLTGCDMSSRDMCSEILSGTQIPEAGT